jgi:hypothetical protein
MMAHPEPMGPGDVNPPDPVLTKRGDWLRLLDSKPHELSDSREIIGDSRTDNATRVDVSTREQVPIGPSDLQSATAPPTPSGSVEDALAGALTKAAAAGQWELVAQLARELEARRLGAADVTTVGGARRSDG